MSIFATLLRCVSKIFISPYSKYDSKKFFRAPCIVCKNENLRCAVLFFIAFSIPSTSHAAVIINEVAWMGTEVSANDEWIELYNDGSSTVSLDGWMLTDGMNLVIELAGTVGAGEYAVLERTDDSSAPGTAFLIYTGALTNTGATLKLIRDDGGIEDQVAGGENWENIGGDNVTKESAQYTSSGWVTAAATPGVKNSTYGSVKKTDNESDEEESTVTAKKTSNKETVIKTENWELELTLTAPDIAYVNQPVAFDMEPNGLPDVLLNSVVYNWNLGDLTAVSGKNVTHRFRYPGKYVVFVEGVFKEHVATIRHEITVLPVSFSITKNPDGDVQINNDAKYEVDLSGYGVRGDTTIVFPENTILLPNATITIPKENIGGSSYAWLFDQNANIVASVGAEPAVQHVATGEAVVPVPAVPVAEMPMAFLPPERNANQNFTFSDESTQAPIPQILATATTKLVQKAAEEKPESQTATVNQANVPIDASKLPYLGLIGVLSLGILALYASRVQ